MREDRKGPSDRKDLSLFGHFRWALLFYGLDICRSGPVPDPRPWNWYLALLIRLILVPVHFLILLNYVASEIYILKNASDNLLDFTGSVVILCLCLNGTFTYVHFLVHESRIRDTVSRVYDFHLETEVGGDGRIAAKALRSSANRLLAFVTFLWALLYSTRFLTYLGVSAMQRKPQFYVQMYQAFFGFSAQSSKAYSLSISTVVFVYSILFAWISFGFFATFCTIVDRSLQRLGSESVASDSHLTNWVQRHRHGLNLIAAMDRLFGQPLLVWIIFYMLIIIIQLRLAIFETAPVPQFLNCCQLFVNLAMVGYVIVKAAKVNHQAIAAMKTLQCYLPLVETGQYKHTVFTTQQAAPSVQSQIVGSIITYTITLFQLPSESSSSVMTTSNISHH